MYMSILVSVASHGFKLTIFQKECHKVVFKNIKLIK